MPCKGIKHKPHYTKEDIQKAVKKVRTGWLSYWQTQEIYGIPKSTISDKINRHCVKLNSNKPGPKCYLLPDIEEHIQVVAEDGKDWKWGNQAQPLITCK